ncbi:sigma-70 family RNA polymerase sigma factor [Nocardia jiangsuensis]|uniref:Sigma-70 family RNA polymerase sigma factor n=1 Tax=Nocardia jiangsuensis TaxID=1691563 RepID=A0ABV8DPR3_9NOCA
MTRSSTNTSAAARVGRSGTDSYDDLEPAFARLSGLGAADPVRARLREEIITAAMPLGQHIAARFSGRGEAAEDLTQAAYLGVVLAVDRFELDKGSSFLAFAVPTIMGEVRRHFRDRTWAVRVPRPVKDLQQRLSPAVEALCRRFGRMPTARELAAELDVDIIEVTQAMMAANGYPQRVPGRAARRRRRRRSRPPEARRPRPRGAQLPAGRRRRGGRAAAAGVAPP